MNFAPSESTEIHLVTLGQLSKGGSWKLDLVHDWGDHVLIWVTRGQGVALLDGARTGIGTHNAIFVPARHLMALDMGRQGFGQALFIPPSSGLRFPETVQHLRIRDARAQADLTLLLDSLAREQSDRRPLGQSAMTAYAYLAAIWLRRQIPEDAPATAPETQERSLSRAYFARLASTFSSGATLADHARALNTTSTDLAHACQAETGKSAAALLTERLLHASRQLLGETQAPVSEVAQQLGFKDVAHFARFIQQQTGHPPVALRRAAAAPADPSGL
ncbi:helix-turn-helix domain-containing protein [Pontibaca salina]|uniref:Helix-turn-helix domain-containing protein n=1 Tax=Pontibaca salina TaxID=2795731 RepID=A0A934HLH4_9RHOB|nr:helix-turn-helix domain-containing protein [Pontibaca salina]MBI6630394.1 helix-turn-helix domain-containing protein [Pontibaca salina]